ncbi:hypothetical protein Drorol1_Dr00013173 [Drosera rotundifolia]
MSAGDGDRSSESEEVVGEKPRKESKIRYSREVLLSLSELEVCKKLPSGVDESVLRELDECCQQAVSTGGALGDFTKPVLRGNNAASNRDSDLKRFCSYSWPNRWKDGILGSCSMVERTEAGADADSSKSHQTSHLLSRCSQPYRPPGFYKAANYSRREHNDSFNGDTFGSRGMPGPERLEEERRRKASFDSTRKWEKKMLPDHGQSLTDDQKENLDPDIICSVKETELKDQGTMCAAASESGLSCTSLSGMLEDKLGSKPSIHLPELQAASRRSERGRHEKDNHGGSCTQLYQTEEIDAKNKIKMDDLSIVANNGACLVHKSPESCVDQEDAAAKFEPLKPSEDTTSTRCMSAQNHSAPMLEEIRDAASVSEIWNLPSLVKPFNINKIDAMASKFAHLFADGDEIVVDASSSCGSTVANGSSGILWEHDIQSLMEKNQTTSKLPFLTAAASAESVSELFYHSTVSRTGFKNPIDEGYRYAAQGREMHNESEQQYCSSDANTTKQLLTILQNGTRATGFNMSQEIAAFPGDVYHTDATYLGMGLISGKSNGSQWLSSQGPEHGRDFMNGFQSREASVFSLKDSGEKLRKAEAEHSELCMSHMSQFKPQLSHCQNTLGQPVESSKVKTPTPVSVGSKFKHLHGFVGKADSAADHFQLPTKENLVPVDDTVIYEPPTPKLSLNPRNKLMSRGNLDQRYVYNRSQGHANDARQSPAMILSHSLERSDTRIKRQVPDFPALRMQHDSFLPSYLFHDPAADMPAYACCNLVPRHVPVPDSTPSFPLSYQQNLNPNMDELFSGCASGGNPIGFSRLSEMELRLKQLMAHDARARHQRDLNERSLYRY